MSSPASVDLLLTRHDSLLDGFFPEPKAITSTTHRPSGPGLFDLPPEVRTQIYTYLFDPTPTYAAAFPPSPSSSDLILSPSYSPSSFLLPLLTCRTLHHDAHLLAFSRTLFVVANPYLALALGPHMASRLSPAHVSAVRHVAFVADARHFRTLSSWHSGANGGAVFGVPGLRLERLSVVLARSSYWLYLFDFNVALVTMLRRLEGVGRVDFVRNGALVKGTLFTWYNRLIKLMLKTDVVERFEKGMVENQWWGWECDREKQLVTLVAKEPKTEAMSMEEYMRVMAPLYEALVLSMESEEVDTDPMSRVSVGM